LTRPATDEDFVSVRRAIATHASKVLVNTLLTRLRSPRGPSFTRAALTRESRERVGVARGDDSLQLGATDIERGEFCLNRFQPLGNLLRRALRLPVARESSRGLILQTPAFVNLKLDGGHPLRVEVRDANRATAPLRRPDVCEQEFADALVLFGVAVRLQVAREVVAQLRQFRRLLTDSRRRCRRARVERARVFELPVVPFERFRQGS